MNAWLAARERWLTALTFAAGFLVTLHEFFRKGFTGLIHDEWAYLFQADTLLRGRASLPPPPLPEFFEAPQVLVDPVYAAKYYPGHALLLAPFAAFDAAFLWPCLCVGAASALLFRFARSCGLSPIGALTASACLCLSPSAWAVFGTYLSHSSSLLLGMAVLFLLSDAKGPRRWLLAGAALALCLLTRPLNGLVLAAAALLAAWTCAPADRRARLSRTLSIALPAAAALALWLVWSWRITGDWHTSPWALWARQYTPFDGMGLGPPRLDAPARTIPPQLRFVTRYYFSTREHYAWGLLGKTALERLLQWLEFLPSPFLLPLFALGVARLRSVPRALWLIGPSVVLFVLQLGFHASPPQYFTELLPGLALVAGLGADGWLALSEKSGDRPRRALAILGVMAAGLLAFCVFAADLDAPGGAGLVTFAISALVLSFTGPGRTPNVARAALSAFLLALTVLSARDAWLHDQFRWREAPLQACADPAERSTRCAVTRQLQYERFLDQVRAAHGVVFIRPTEDTTQEFPLLNPGLGVQNDLPLVRATDLGERDAELLRLFPGRPAFKLDMRAQTLTPYP